jgi:hypothetical protein
MATDSDGPDPAGLSPEDAFTTLGSDTRMEILRTLGEADSPLSFSELHDRVSLSDSGQFNYHLGKLTGHFVQQAEEGYKLRPPGRRVVQAVLSGAITDRPMLEPTVVEAACPYCDAPTVVTYHSGALRHYCTNCQGTYGEMTVAPTASEGGEEDGWDGPERLGFLGGMGFPPAGIQGRPPTAVFEATLVWGGLEFVAMGRGICPRCSAPVERSVGSRCEDHDGTRRVCPHCESRYAVLCEGYCSNCEYDPTFPAVSLLPADRGVLAFLTAHGVDPYTDGSELEWREQITETDPFEARCTCTLDGETLAVTVDASLSVVDVTRTSS